MGKEGSGLREGNTGDFSLPSEAGLLNNETIIKK